MRLCRLASRSGIRHAYLHIGKETKAIESALQWRGPGLTVDLVTDAPSDDALDGAALFLAINSAPLIRIRDKKDLRDAKRLLWAATKKSILADGVVAYYLGEPLSSPLTRLLLPTRIRANAVTGLAMVIGLLGGIFAATGHFVTGFGLYFLGSILDSVDGRIARMRLESSRVGEWLDTLADDGSTLAITLGVTVGLYSQGGSLLILVIGLLATLCYASANSVVYIHLAQTEGPIDTARFSWWFMKTPACEAGDNGVLGYLRYLVRRDFQTLFLFILALLGLTWAAFSWFVVTHFIAAALLFENERRRSLYRSTASR